MITGFLFTRKIISNKRVDWLRLYVSRVMRLSPLYIFSVGVLFLIVFVSSGFTLHESVAKIFISVVKWFAFTVVGAPDVNLVEHTSKIMAGVTWSLPYEWFFYFSLPALGFILKRKAAWWMLFLSMMFLFLFFILTYIKPAMYNLFHLTFFFSGIVAAFLSDNKYLLAIANHKLVTLALVCGMCFDMIFYSSAYSFVPWFLLTITIS